LFTNSTAAFEAASANKSFNGSSYGGDRSSNATTRGGSLVDRSFNGPFNAALYSAPPGSGLSAVLNPGPSPVFHQASQLIADGKKSDSLSSLQRPPQRGPLSMLNWGSGMVQAEARGIDDDGCAVSQGGSKSECGSTNLFGALQRSVEKNGFALQVF